MDRIESENFNPLPRSSTSGGAWVPSLATGSTRARELADELREYLPARFQISVRAAS
jgi:hypothetical protein